MFTNIKTIKKWLVLPICGKTTFKVVEYKYLIQQHKMLPKVKREELHSFKTVLTDKPLDECNYFVHKKEHNLK